MNITYASHHYEITSDDREYAAEKITSIAKFVPKDGEIKIEFAKDGKQKSGVIYRIDMTVFGAGKTHAVGHGESMREAIDMAKDELKLRISKLKDKKSAKTKATGARVKKALRGE